MPDEPEADATVLRLLEHADAVRVSDGRRLTDGDVAGAEHLRVNTSHGIVDMLRGRTPPLDFETVAAGAETVDFRGHPVRVVSLRSLVGFKRLADRPDPDRSDLRHLEAIHGPLPVDPIPGPDC